MLVKKEMDPHICSLLAQKIIVKGNEMTIGDAEAEQPPRGAHVRWQADPSMRYLICEKWTQQSRCNRVVGPSCSQWIEAYWLLQPGAVVPFIHAPRRSCGDAQDTVGYRTVVVVSGPAKWS